MSMMSAKPTLPGSGRLTRAKVLALLLVGALLLCHGIYGVVHLCSASSVFVSEGHEYSSLAQMGMVDHEDHPSCHPEGAEYFAVLFAAFLGLVLGLLLEGARPYGKVATSFALDLRLRPSVPYPPRGPTLTVLQVFRL
jgi:hypothetical protein